MFASNPLEARGSARHSYCDVIDPELPGGRVGGRQLQPVSARAARRCKWPHGHARRVQSTARDCDDNTMSYHGVAP